MVNQELSSELEETMSLLNANKLPMINFDIQFEVSFEQSRRIGHDIKIPIPQRVVRKSNFPAGSSIIFSAKGFTNVIPESVFIK